jgi:hypothetical protein
MALRDRQTGWQGSLGWKAAFQEFASNQIGVALYSMRAVDPASTFRATSIHRCAVVLVAYLNICFDRALVRSTTVKRARMLCRPGALRRHGLSNDLRFWQELEDDRFSRCERNCAVTV